jgi:hypothetical protein
MQWAVYDNDKIAHLWVNAGDEEGASVYRACSQWPKGDLPHWESRDTLRSANRVKRCLQCIKHAMSNARV